MPSRRHSGVEVAAQLTHSRPSGRDNEVDVLALGGHLFSVSVIALAPREIEIEWDYRISRIPPLEIRLSGALACARAAGQFLSARPISISLGVVVFCGEGEKEREAATSSQTSSPLGRLSPSRRYVTPEEMSQAMNGKENRSPVPLLSSTACPCQHLELTTPALPTSCRALSLFSHFLVFRCPR